MSIMTGLWELSTMGPECKALVIAWLRDEDIKQEGFVWIPASIYNFANGLDKASRHALADLIEATK